MLFKSYRKIKSLLNIMVDIEVKKNKNLSSHFIEKFVRILPGNYKLFMDENLHFIYISTSAELNGSI